MTKGEYKAAYSELWQKEKQIKEQLEQMENDYLEENAEYKPGDKVLVKWEDFRTQKEAIAYVSSYWCDMSGDIHYNFIKAKKDGSPHHQKLHLYGANRTIELLEPAKD